jgi:hypothetical protein
MRVRCRDGAGWTCERADRWIEHTIEHDSADGSGRYGNMSERCCSLARTTEFRASGAVAHRQSRTARRVVLLRQRTDTHVASVLFRAQLDDGRQCADSVRHSVPRALNQRMKQVHSVDSSQIPTRGGGVVSGFDYALAKNMSSSVRALLLPATRDDAIDQAASCHRVACIASAAAQDRLLPSTAVKS